MSLVYVLYMQEQKAVNQQMEKDQLEKFREQLQKKFRDHQVTDQQICGAIRMANTKKIQKAF